MLEPAIPTRVLGRYALHGEVASGGMATVHYGRLLGGAGFSKVVAIKRLHPQFAKDPEFSTMFLDEARLTARVRHPNVVATLDVVASEGELFLVMEYVHGDSLSRLLAAVQQAGENIPPPIVAAILAGALHGLHAAHQATNERGEPLNIVHRDVSPQNILVGADGVARVLDFGVAKATGRLSATQGGLLKGKLGYMSPEHLRGQVSRATDVFAASVVLWEALAGRRLFSADSEGEVVGRIIEAKVDPPSRHAPAVPPELDVLTLRGLARDPKERFSSAREMARALESALPAATASEVSDFVERWARASLEDRARQIAAIESGSEPLAARAATAVASGVLAPAAHDATASNVAGELETQLSASSHLVHRTGAGTGGTWRRAAIAGSAIAAVGLALGAGVRLGKHAATRGATAAAPASASGAAIATASEPAASAPATASAYASASVSAPASAPASVRDRPARHPTRAPSGLMPTGCSPPYTLDADGIRHYKRECAR
jgi:serine/threonine-protein kinase